MRKVKNYKNEELLTRVSSLKSFKGFPNSYWICGVRSNDDTFDVYDDVFYLFNGQRFILSMTGTTNPGSKSLLNFKQDKLSGSPVIVADQCYYDVWKKGLHRGKMPALVQVGGFLVLRDDDGDKLSGNNGKASWEMWKGLNFHANNYDLKSRLVKWIIGGWSKGCQVSNDIPNYQKAMFLIPEGQKVSYILLNEF